MGGPQNRSFQFYGGRDVKTPTNYIYLGSTQWDLQNGTHIDYKYSFGKNGRKAVRSIQKKRRYIWEFDFENTSQMWNQAKMTKIMHILKCSEPRYCALHNKFELTDL